jgi:uncharacterized protein YjdB
MHTGMRQQPHELHRCVSRTIQRILVAAVSGVLIGCGGGGADGPPPPPPPPVVATVRVSPDTNALVVGGTLQLVAAALDANGNALTGQNSTWSSSQPTIASVTSTGLVTGLRAGAASIVAISGGKTGSATVVVSAPVSVSCDASTPISLRETVNGVLASTDCQLPDKRYTDKYAVTLTEPTALRMTMISASADAFLIVQNAVTGAVVAENDDGNGGTDSRVERLFPAGRYLVLATTFDPLGTGAYQLTIGPAQPVCLNATPIVPPATVTATLTTSACQLGDASYADRYELRLPVSSIVTLNLRSTTLDAFLFIESASGELVGRDDDGGSGTDSRLTVTLDAGTYIVYANSVGQPSVGPYILSIDSRLNVCGANSMLTPGTLATDSLTSTGCQLADGSAAVRFQFSVDATRSVRLDMSSTAFDPYLIVQRKGDETILAEDDDGGPGLDAQIVRVFEAGDYVVTATSANSNERGRFTLSASGTPPSGVAITVTPTTANLNAGLTQQLSATVTGSSNTAVSWRSSSPGVATVTETGLVRAITTGTASIVATSAADPTKTATSTFTVNAAGAVNFDVPLAYLVQSIQTPESRIPLLAGRPTVARVFVRGSRGGFGGSTVAVRLRVFNNGALSATLDGQATPSAQVDEGCCSADITIPPALVRTGIAISAEVDPANTITESNESDNTWPATGTSKPETLLSVPSINVQVIPVRHRASGLVGPNDTIASTLMPRMFPIAGYRVTQHAEFVTDLARPVSATQWAALLREIDALRTLERSSEYYFGLLSAPTANGVIGIATLEGFGGLGIGLPVTLAQETFAHEFGHMFGRRHAPTPSTCGSPGAVDPNFPRAEGTIGVFGYDIQGRRAFTPAAYDIMGYCDDTWVSAYTYSGILAYLQSGVIPLTRTGAVNEQPVLLISGGIENGVITLDPVFATQLPLTPVRGAARYIAEGFDTNGRLLFQYPVAARAVADGAPGAESFQASVPFDAQVRGTVARVAVRDLNGTATAAQLTSRAPSVTGNANLRVETSPLFVTQTAPDGNVTITWDAARFPAVIARDTRTNQVLGMGRSGTLTLRMNDVSSLELMLSDGASSVTRRVRDGGSL